jgi:hypothetical protein
MFKFNELVQIHLEITNNCQAACPMCSRNIDSGLKNPLIKIRNWSFDEFKTIMNSDVLGQIQRYYFCGNFGDPILNNDLIQMCAWSKVNAPTVQVVVHTNGGARSTDWWRKLAHALPEDHRVVFALDGLEDTHHLYRVGTKYETVIENATAFISAGGTAEWVFIKFKHNEHQTDEARGRSIELGFKAFVLKNSARFILEPQVKVVNRTGDIMHYIEPASDTPLKFIDKKIIQAYKQIVNTSVIECKVQKEKEVYIDAHGDLFPCCWIASVPYTYLDPDDAMEVRTEMLRQHHEMVATLGVVNTVLRPINDIIDSPEYQTVWHEYWTTNKLITCARTCGVSDVKFAQPRDQIVQ